MELGRAVLHCIVGAGYLLGVSKAHGQTSVHLKARTVHTSTGRVMGGPDPLSLSGRATHLLLQFPYAPGARDLAELARRDIRVLRAVPDNGLMVAVPHGVDLTGLGLRWAGWMEGSDKLSPALDETAPAYVVVFHDDVNEETTRRLVADAGLDQLDHQDLLPHQLLIAGPYEKVAQLAGWDEVAYILPASADLVLGNPVSACAGALSAEVRLAEYVIATQGWQEANGSADLRYVITNRTGRLSDSMVRSEVSRALQEWSRYARVNFTPGTDATAASTITILFARGSHADAYPFDGTGKVLAHTFYPHPTNPEPIAGDMHFDDDEDWSVGRDVDLFSVALHEAGHALGLGHSDRPGSVMYPYYRISTVLSDDDITAIRNLYGSRSAVIPPSGGTSGAPAGMTPDTTPPTIRLTSPASNIASTNADTITCRGVATDSVGVTSITWSTSSGAAGTAIGTIAWIADIPLSKGSNAVTLTAFDAAGNSTRLALTVTRR
jgi:matrixin/glucodextranase-like protein